MTKYLQLLNVTPLIFVDCANDLDDSVDSCTS
jgi:hypothetical protein